MLLIECVMHKIILFYVLITLYYFPHFSLIVQSPQYGSTSLHKAALYGRLDVVSLLVARGANVEAVDKVRSLSFMTCGAVPVVCCNRVYLTSIIRYAPHQLRSLVNTLFCPKHVPQRFSLRVWKHCVLRSNWLNRVLIIS